MGERLHVDGLLAPRFDLEWAVATTTLLGHAEHLPLMTRPLGWDIDTYEQLLRRTWMHIATTAGPEPAADRLATSAWAPRTDLTVGTGWARATRRCGGGFGAVWTACGPAEAGRRIRARAADQALVATCFRAHPAAPERRRRDRPVEALAYALLSS
jgi:hypothetical protein